MVAEAVEPATATVRAEAPRGDPSETATVVRFFVAPGDEIMAGAAVCRLHTGRFLYDLPAPSSGIVERLLVEPGVEIELGASLLIIGSSEVAIVQHEIMPAVRATPLARAIAAAYGLDLGQLAGAEYGRHIRAADVRAAVGESSDRDITDQGHGRPSVDVPSLRSRMPAHPFMIMHDDRPLALTAMEIDCTAEVVADQQVARIVHATSQALLTHSWLNSRWTDGCVLVYGRITLGLWRDTPDGASLLLLDNAADLSLRGIERALQACSNASGEARAAAASATFNIVIGQVSWWSEPLQAHGASAALHIGPPEHRVVVEADSDRLAIKTRRLAVLSYDARHIAQPAADSLLSCVRARVEHRRCL
jgi:pyruvate/2-oxoglutarate dehydrogenase complex dihydrolipoamide acyltransferase (E2) component